MVELLPTGEVAPGTQPVDIEAVAARVVHREEQHRQFERSRLEMMRNYAELLNCRRAYLLNYFGEPFEPPCGNCDICDAGKSSSTDAEARPFPLNSRVTHRIFGDGMVQRYDGDTMVVLFDEVGYKTLDAEAVVEEGLLTAAS